MKRGRVRKQAVGVQLFPFLAVLICTMGALIALLVMEVQQARLEAASIVESEQEHAAHDQEQAQEALRLEQEEHDWRREELERQRTAKLKELADQRLELSHLEDHIRRLEERCRQMSAAAQELQQTEQGRDADLWAARQELQQLRAAAEKARQELEVARAEAAGRQRGFAIIPYDGPQGTQRRPIYIECRQDGIVIQPEGIVLHADDFEGPLGPGNPLDASLRAIREYMVRQGTLAPGSEPYPLLVVRPDGAVAYAVARAAMKSWEDEFGYELIDADMPLVFPKPDPELAKLLEKSVQDARQRQKILAAAMPSEYAAPPAPGLVATSRHGGFVMAGGGDEEDWDMGPRGTGQGGRSFTAPTVAGGRNPVGHVGTFQDAERAATGAGEFSTGSGDPSAGISGPRSQGSLKEGPAGGTKGQPAGAAGASSDSSTDSQNGAGGNVATGSLVSQRAAGAKSTGKLTGKTRGNNWGLPESSQSLTGITRPVNIQCGPNLLSVVPERGERGVRRRDIAVPGTMNDVIDDFVAAVWKHVDSWGIAVAGGYWKPVLDVQVLPGAEARFQEFQTLMENSGLHVRRKMP